MTSYDILSAFQGRIFSLSLSAYPVFSPNDSILNFAYIQNIFTDDTKNECITYLSKFEIVPDLYFRFFTGAGLFRFHLNVGQVKRLTACTFCPMVADIDIQSDSKVLVVLKTVYTCCQTSSTNCIRHKTYTFTFDNINTSKTSDQQDVFFPYWKDPFKNGCIPDGMTKATLVMQLSDNFTIQRRQNIGDFRDTCPNSTERCPNIPIAPDTTLSYFATPGFILVNLVRSDDSLTYFYFLNDFTLFDPLVERLKTAVSIQRVNPKSVIPTNFCITCEDIYKAIDTQRTTKTIGVIGLSNPEAGRIATDKFRIPNINLIYGMYPNNNLSPNIFNVVRNGDIVRLYSRSVPPPIRNRFLSYKVVKGMEPYPSLSCTDVNSCNDPYIYWQIVKNNTDSDPIKYGDYFYLRSMSQYKPSEPAYACLYVSNEKNRQGMAPFLKGNTGECETWFFVNPNGGTDNVLYDSEVWIKSFGNPDNTRICPNGGKYIYSKNTSEVGLERPSSDFNRDKIATWQILKADITIQQLLCSQ